MHSTNTVNFLFVFLLIFCSTLAIEWDYHKLGPDVWNDIEPLCAGPAQSPINIQTPCTVYRNFSAFQLLPFYHLNQTLRLYNNGHAITATLVNQTANPPTLQGGGLNGTYEFINFHLHWAENYGAGSEHEVNGMKYAGEAHFVHANTETDALAVLGFFITTRRNSSSHSRTSRRRRRDNVVQTSEQEWIKYFTAASYLNETGNQTIIDLDLSALMGDRLADFWRYAGSLTVPPCTEGVTWTVFTEPIELDDNVLEILRDNIFSTIYRAPQPLNGRTVYRNFLNNTFPTAGDDICCAKTSRANRSNVKSISLSFILLFLFAHLFVL